MIRTPVNPELLRWARERAGIVQEDLTERFRTLPEWESGDVQPSKRQVEAFACAVHAPVGYLFLSKPPREAIPTPDFRTFAGHAVTRPTPISGVALASATGIRFGRGDVAVLREAARSFRERAPRPDVSLHGFVRHLNRPEEEADGTISLVTELDGQPLSIIAVLESADYERAIEAHKGRVMVSLVGDLECMGQRWRLLNPRIVGVLRDNGPEIQDS